MDIKDKIWNYWETLILNLKSDKIKDGNNQIKLQLISVS